MAIDKTVRYPGRWDPVSTEYPLGQPKNRTSATAKDGTYFEKDWLSDYEAFIASVFSSMGKTSNGTVDEVGASQIFRALKELISGGATLHTDSGTANTYVLTSAHGEAPELFDGIKVTFIAATDSTGASTLNVNGNGAQSLVLDADGTAITNEIISGALYEAYYDLSNTRWIVSSGVSTGSGGSTRADELIKIITQDSNAVIYPEVEGAYAGPSGSYTSPSAATHLIVSTTDGLKLVEIEDGPATGTITALDTTTYPMTATIGGTAYDLKRLDLTFLRKASLGLNNTYEEAEYTNTGALFADGTPKYRATGATFTAPEDRPIFIIVTSYQGNASADKGVIISIDGAETYWGITAPANVLYSSSSVLVPAGATYSVTQDINDTNLIWKECRGL